MKESNRAKRKAKQIAMQLADCVPPQRGCSYNIYSFQTNPISIGYRDRLTDEWVTLASIEIVGNEVYLGDELLTADNYADAIRRAAGQLEHGQTV